MLGKIRNIKKHIAKKLEAAPEAAGCLRLTVIDNTHAYIENHCGILEYTQKRVSISAGDSVVVISGEQLMLERFGRENAAVTGDIRSVQFENLR